MDIKQILIRTKNLITSPEKEWNEIIENGEKGFKAVNNFALPLIGLSTAAAFLGDLILMGFNFEHALVEGILTFGSSYVGIFLAMGIIRFFAPRFNVSQEQKSILTLVVYASSVYFVVEFITNLIPELFFLRILSLYLAFVVWEGVVPILKVEDGQKGGFVLFCSFAILASPVLSSYLLTFLLPNVN